MDANRPATAYVRAESVGKACGQSSYTSKRSPSLALETPWSDGTTHLVLSRCEVI